MRRTASLLLVFALVTGACSEALTAPAPRGGSPEPGSPADDETVRLMNQALGADRARVATAVADLKAIGLWHPLTDHLYVIQVQSRPGAGDVPEDGHLADAALQGFADEDGAGGLCSIMFFPTAVRRNYRRWDADPSTPGFQAPPRRAVWASILAHELGHCFPGQPGEPVATAWERRALNRLIPEN